MSKLRCFILKTIIKNDLGFSYLKCLLNNLNHVQKLQLRLGIKPSYTDNTSIWKSGVDANFIRQCCMPDVVTNLTHFNFFIILEDQLRSSKVQNIVSSFQNHSFFLDRQWTNVRCLFDSTITYQYLFSSTIAIPQLVVDFV